MRRIQGRMRLAGTAALAMLMGIAPSGCHRQRQSLPHEAVHPWPPVFGSADRGATPLHHSFRGGETNGEQGSGSAADSALPPMGSTSPDGRPVGGPIDTAVRPVGWSPGSFDDPNASRAPAAPIGGAAAGLNATSADTIRPAVPPAGFVAFRPQESIDGRPMLDAASEGEFAPTAPVAIGDVFASVLAHYPQLVAVRLEQGIASGQLRSDWGAFDTRLSASSLDKPVGFYENYRQQVGFDQPLFGGGSVRGGYRIGDGSFEPWYKERETNEGGELSIAVGFPLLKGRVIDERRADLLRSTLALQAVEPMVRREMIGSLRDGGISYWEWFAATRAVDAHRRLYDLAAVRVDQIEALIRAGDQPDVVRLDNRRLLASRQAKLIDAQRKALTTAIKLSLYLRSEAGTPWVADAALVPSDFPPLPAMHTDSLAQDLTRALSMRPEFRQLELEREREAVALAKAENDLLPKLDASLGAAQDLGARASSSGDKSPFEGELGVYGEMPIQFRQARGKIESLQAKIRQIDVKLGFVADKVNVELSAAAANLDAALRSIEQDRIQLETAGQALELARLRFEEGDIDLIMLNIYEQAVTDAELNLIYAQAAAFVAELDYLAAIGDLVPATE
ncbi:MAG TPA: TolC family protein [Pirellulaceae bacterium]|nr:TolC family protein [Pirellulaceae bacterium]